MSSEAAPARVFRIAVVCTANRIRSPLAAAVLLRQLDGLPFEIVSRGTLDVGPLPPLVGALQAAQRYGLTLSAHRARKIALGELVEADLVIGFERAHLVAAIQEGLANPAVVFTLPELVALLDRLERSADETHSGPELIRAAEKLRQGKGDGALAEIDDPIGQPPDAFAEAADRVRDLAQRLAEHLSRSAR